MNNDAKNDAGIISDSFTAVYEPQMGRLAIEENVRLRERLREYEAEIRDLRKRLDQYQPGRSIPIPPRERRRD